MTQTKHGKLSGTFTNVHTLDLYGYKVRPLCVAGGMKPPALTTRRLVYCELCPVFFMSLERQDGRPSINTPEGWEDLRQRLEGEWMLN